MEKKTFMAVIVVWTLLFLMVPVVNPVKAQFLGSVYINSDGSVAGTNNITREGDVYTLTGNISGGIQIQKSHIVLDGAGYAVLGDGDGRGIDLSNGRGQDSSRPEVDNVTVKNLKIVDFYYGVDNANTNNNTFIGNYVENCLNSFWIVGSKNNLITFNTLKNASIAINYAGTSTLSKNNFIDSMVFVFLSFPPIVEGNYWSDYTARYPNASEIGNTGVGDTPYVFWTQQNGNETVTYQDNHPSIRPINIANPPLPTPAPSVTPTPTSSSALTVSLSESASALNYGSTVNFTVTADWGTKPYTYVWYLDNQSVQTSDSPYYSTSTQAVGSHHVYVQVTDAASNSAQTLTVEFNVLPVSSFSPSPSSTTQPTMQPSPTSGKTQTGDFTAVAILVGIAIVVAVIAGAIVYFRRRGK